MLKVGNPKLEEWRTGSLCLFSVAVSLASLRLSLEQLKTLRENAFGVMHDRIALEMRRIRDAIQEGDSLLRRLRTETAIVPSLHDEEEKELTQLAAALSGSFEEQARDGKELESITELVAAATRVITVASQHLQGSGMGRTR